MKLSIQPEALTNYVKTQMQNLFPDANVDRDTLAPLVDEALERTEACFQKINLPNYTADGEVMFNHLHSDQYATFLYFLGNSAFRHGVGPDLPAKAYLLNKALHGVEIFYEVTLPENFLLVHPVGSVLGRATYGNYFTAYQGCTIGSNVTGEYPVFGEGVSMFAGSRAIGQCRIGANTMISTGTTVLNTDVPENSLAILKDGAMSIKANRRNVIDYVFRRIF
ncbi:MAG: serine acetyltransferase [Rhodospirillales bacterium]|nr:serine acetyltransferase [Rhodospirillales bacterium]